MKNWAYIAKLLVSVAAVYYVVDRFDLSNIGQKLFEQNGWLFLAAILLSVVQILVAGARWYVILQALGLVRPMALVLRIFYGTAFLNSFLPAGIAGDAVRIWLVKDKSRGVAVALSSVVLDRIVTLVALVAVALLAQTILWIERGSYGLVALTAAFGGALIGGGLATIVIGAVLPSRTRYRLLNALFDFIRAIGDAIRLLVTSRSASIVLGVALLGNLLLIMILYVLGLGQSMELSLGVYLVTMPVVLLVAALPISIAGWGTRELAMVYMLGLFGVAADQATSISVSFGVCSTIASVPGILVWLLFRGNPPPVEAQAESG